MSEKLRKDNWAAKMVRKEEGRRVERECKQEKTHQDDITESVYDVIVTLLNVRLHDRCISPLCLHAVHGKHTRGGDASKEN